MIKRVEGFRRGRYSRYYTAAMVMLLETSEVVALTPTIKALRADGLYVRSHLVYSE